MKGGVAINGSMLSPLHPLPLLVFVCPLFPGLYGEGQVQNLQTWGPY